MTDNYPSLRRGEFVKFMEKNGIEHILITPNHPSSNGMVERVNKTLTDRLKIKVLENPKLAWTTHIQKCVEEYNITPHTITKYQPKYLMTGIDEDNLYQEETLNESRKKAKENADKQHEISSKMFDKGRINQEFHIGDLIYVETKHKLNRKPLEPKYQGPYEIIEKVSQTVYKVNVEGTISNYHVSQFKSKSKQIDKGQTLKFNLLSLLLINFYILMIFISAVRALIYEPSGPFVWHQSKHIPVNGYKSKHQTPLSQTDILLLQVETFENGSRREKFKLFILL